MNDMQMPRNNQRDAIERKEDGGAAFPVSHEDGEILLGSMGMSLRDYFAAKALQGYASNARVMDNAIDGWENSGGARPTCVAEYLAGLSYEVADAMLEARHD